MNNKNSLIAVLYISVWSPEELFISSATSSLEGICRTALHRRRKLSVYTARCKSSAAVMKILLMDFSLLLIVQMISGDVLFPNAVARIPKPVKTIRKMEDVILKNVEDRESDSLLGLLRYVGEIYLQDCSTTMILYDELFERSHHVLIRKLLKDMPFTYIKKQVNVSHSTSNDTKWLMDQFEGSSCSNFVIFIDNLNKLSNVLDRQSVRKVVAICGASSWTVFDFLKGPVARLYTNLLIAAPSTSKNAKAGSFLLYTHKLYSDGIGSSRPVVLTSWIKDSLTRPETVLFPKKLSDGFNGHRFRIAATHKPPFAIRRVIPSTDEVRWDGIDIRLIMLLSKVLNFTVEVREPGAAASFGSVKAVSREISSGKSSIALGGLYRTVDLMTSFDTTFPHTYDCASFISLTSTALPRYRAVLGPFRPSVWITLTFAYLGAIIPLTLSSKNSLLSLITSPKALNEMFWYVFSTFTNCFTIRSPLVYEGMAQNATGILIGLYWVFTIIVTSCYTSSIIAFITIPVYPTAMDSSDQLLRYRYRIGTLDHDGWESFFQESDDPRILKLFKKLELVPSVGEGIKNASRAYFWPYAFLGSRAMLEYIVQADFTPGWKTKRSLMHISRECFVQFGVTIAFPRGSVYTETLNKVSQRAYQSGLMQKITSDVKWEVQRSATGRLLQVSSEGTLHIPSAEERQLTLDDIQGMFMVLGAGVLIASFVLLLECCCRSVSKRCSKTHDADYSDESEGSVRKLSSGDSTYKNYCLDDYETPYILMRNFRRSI